MARPEGSKNTPKTTEYYLKKLKEAADAEGIEFDHILKPKPTPNPDENNENEAAQAAELRGRFLKLEIELESDEADTWECGNCGETMGTAMPKCPSCGTNLNW